MIITTIMLCPSILRLSFSSQTQTGRIIYLYIQIIFEYIYLSSFCYLLETDRDIYKDMKESNIFDFTNYSPLNEYYDGETNKLVPGKILIINHIEYDVTLRIITGKFKDEMGGKAIEEFVGLRSKMYSIKAKDGEQKNTAKGVRKYTDTDYPLNLKTCL